MKKKIIILISVLLLSFIFFYLGRHATIEIPFTTYYCTALEKAVQQKDPTVCETITWGKDYGDEIISKAQTIELCKAQYSVEAKDLDYCKTLSTTLSTYERAKISQRDFCLGKLAKQLQDPEICNLIGNGENIDNDYSSCKLNAIKPILKVKPCRNWEYSFMY